MKDTKNAVIPLVRDEYGNYLLITRTGYEDHKGEWGPIAGHLYEGESIEDALIRETKEELNLDVEPGKQIAVLDQDVPGDKGFWWTCRVLGGEIKTNEEIEKYKYFSVEEIKKIKLWPATRKFFKEFIWNEDNKKNMD